MEALLAFANQQAVRFELLRREQRLRIDDLLVFHVQAAALNQPTRFALGGKDSGAGQDIDQLAADYFPGNSYRRCIIECACAAEQSLGRLLGPFGFFLAVHQLRHFKSQHFLGRIDFLIPQRAQSADFLHRQERQQRQAFCNVGIIHIAPVLVEIVGRSFFRVQPKRALLGLAHLASVAGRQQGKGKAERRFGFLAPDQVRSG